MGIFYQACHEAYGVIANAKKDNHEWREHIIKSTEKVKSYSTWWRSALRVYKIDKLHALSPKHLKQTKTNILSQ